MNRPPRVKLAGRDRCPRQTSCVTLALVVMTPTEAARPAVAPYPATP